MQKAAINAADAPAPVGGYPQAVLLTEFKQLLFVSGQIPVGHDCDVPTGFNNQCALAWRMSRRSCAPPA